MIRPQASPWVMWLSTTKHQRRSNCDQFGRGVDIIVDHTNTPVFPVSAILAYIVQRQDQPGPFFVNDRNAPVTKGWLVQQIRSILSSLGQVISMQTIVSELEPLQRQPWQVLRSPPFRSSGGVVLPFWNIFGCRRNGLQLCLKDRLRQIMAGDHPHKISSTPCTVLSQAVGHRHATCSEPSLHGTYVCTLNCRRTNA